MYISEKPPFGNIDMNNQNNSQVIYATSSIGKARRVVMVLYSKCHWDSTELEHQGPHLGTQTWNQNDT